MEPNEIKKTIEGLLPSLAQAHNKSEEAAATYKALESEWKAQDTVKAAIAGKRKPPKKT